ncbi:MAG: alanine--tRNA ligase [Phycisphaeraceae bacterium]|nr:alanine--tRNA ligase [Phycisphaeraceae bacterium]
MPPSLGSAPDSPTRGPRPIPHHMTADEIRRQFIDFFRSRPGPGAAGHTFVPSSPVVPHDDPTLLFTNAGMNQFKPIFLGQVQPGSPLAGLSRATNSQKCIRAGGKHNDLEDVGKDTYHHTFFEMLGNWSFGDYFKAESIAWGFELLTKVYRIPPGRLYATYFKGDPASGLEPDLEARDLWSSLLPRGHVLPGNMKDNFWEMGETGPCGPCSEIHYDRIGDRDASRLVNAGDPNVLEIWNHVFIQFNREDAGSLRPLPARHVDTGMGLERLVSVLQNKLSNYDTDLFMPIFAAIERATGARPYMGRLGEADNDGVDTAYRVIADHIRALTFAITDGAVPSNEGRGYVLRRILRRAVRYGRQMLGAKGGFFSNLVPVVVDRMGEFFPELTINPSRVRDILKEEEDSFGKTLDRGISLTEKAMVEALSARIVAEDPSAELKTDQKSRDGHHLDLVFKSGKSGKTTGVDLRTLTPSSVAMLLKQPPIIPGDIVFLLYDTYGFPTDLTRLMAEERGFQVDLAGFDTLMTKAKDKARAGGKFSAQGGGRLTLTTETVAQLSRLGVEPTDDSEKFAAKDLRASVRAVFNGQNFDEYARASLGSLVPVAIILDRTSFYAEMGGQEHDSGRFVVTREAGGDGSHQGGEFRVDSVHAVAGYVLHIGHVARGEIRVGDDVVLSVDHNRRSAIAANHTATHLLNLALRQTLGDGVDQKGSLVAPDRLRFDFSHSKPVSPEELARIESIVRDRITARQTVFAEAGPQTLARSITGLRAVFGEAYPDPVRIVSIGVPVQVLLDDAGNPKWRDYSIEFCGGTHVSNTGDIAQFVLASEEGVAKGVRRLVALTGVPARAAIQSADNLARRIADNASLQGDALAAEAAEIAAEIDQLTLPTVRKHELRATLASLQDRVKASQKQALAARTQEVVAMARRIGESSAASLANVVVHSIEAGSDRGALQAAIDAIQSACPKAAVMLFSPDSEQGKVSVLASVPDLLVKRGLSASDWIRAATEVLGGKGGGKPNSAQGGGTDLSKLRPAIDAAEVFAHRKLT